MNCNKMVRVVPNGIAVIVLQQFTAAQRDSLPSSIRASEEITFKYLPADELVENYLRDPDGQVEVRNAASSDRSCFARFDNGHVVGKNAATSEYLIPDSGIILSTGNPFDFDGNDSERTTTDFREDTGEPYLESQLPSGQSVYDNCFIEFEFQCSTTSERNAPTVHLDYVFGSDEYDGETDRGAQLDNADAFAVFLNGENIALVPDGPLPITINNINGETNAEYYIENQLRGRANRDSPYPGIEADGLTTRLRASGTPAPGWNAMRVVVADVHDGNLDSWALLAAASLSCAEPAASTTMTIRLPGGFNVTTDNPYVQDYVDNLVGERPWTMSMELAIALLVVVAVLALVIPLVAAVCCNKWRKVGQA